MIVIINWNKIFLSIKTAVFFASSSSPFILEMSLSSFCAKLGFERLLQIKPLHKFLLNAHSYESDELVINIRPSIKYYKINMKDYITNDLQLVDFFEILLSIFTASFRHQKKARSRAVSPVMFLISGSEPCSSKTSIIDWLPN